MFCSHCFWVVINGALTHTLPHLAKKRSHSPTPSQKRSHSPTPTHTQLKKDHNYLHPTTPSQKRVTPTHTQPEKGHTDLNLAVNQWKRKFFIIHQLIKFIRNSRSPEYKFCKVQYQTIGISIQYRTNDKSAAVINNFRHMLIKNYIPFICHLSRFPLTSYNIRSFFLSQLLFATVYYFRCYMYYFVNSA